MDHLRKLPILKDVSENKLYILSSLCKIEAHHKGDRLIVEGEIGDKMYIILSGECTVLHTTAAPKVNTYYYCYTTVKLLYSWYSLLLLL
jgi:CRP-like cAMP-binding protein